MSSKKNSSGKTFKSGREAGAAEFSSDDEMLAIMAELEAAETAVDDEAVDDAADEHELETEADDNDSDDDEMEQSSDDDDLHATTIAGCFDGVVNFQFAGWVRDDTDEEKRLEVEIVEDDKVIASGKADIFRPDLQRIGFGDGRYGFALDLPESLFDKKEHKLVARITGDEPHTFGKHTIKMSNPFGGEITNLDGNILRGKAIYDDNYHKNFQIEIVDKGKVVAFCTVTKSGRFEARLPHRLLDGKKHKLSARCKKPRLTFAEATLLLPRDEEAQTLLARIDDAALPIRKEDIDDLIRATPGKDDFDLLIGKILRSGLFDFAYYGQGERAGLNALQAIEHFLSQGAEQGLFPIHGFDPDDYRAFNEEAEKLSNAQCFAHYVLVGHAEKRYFSRAALRRDAADLRVGNLFNSSWYAQTYADDLGKLNPYEHYLLEGWRDGCLPDSRGFDSMLYLNCYADARASTLPPFIHFLKQKGKRIANQSDVDGLTHEITHTGQFDVAYYRQQLSEPLPEGMSEVLHYALNGVKLNLNPNREFDTEYYYRKYPDLHKSSLDIFAHYQKYGKKENRAAKPSAKHQFAQGGRSYDPNKPTVLVVCHECSRTGAPILGLRLIEYFSQWANVVSWAPVFSWNGVKGDLAEDFARASVATITRFFDAADNLWMVREIQRRYSPKFAVANSACCFDIVGALYEEKMPTVTLVHEYADYMERQVGQLLRLSNRVVFPAEGVRAAAEVVARKSYGAMSTNSVVRHQGRCIPPKNENGNYFSEEDILEMIGVVEGEDRPLIVFGCGWVQMRKGVEVFIDAARLVKQKSKRPIRFIWVGGGYQPSVDLAYCAWLKSQIVNSDLENEVFFFEETIDLDPFFALSDVFFLSSRLDPFPNVAIDAVNAGVPIIAFEHGTGFSEFIDRNPSVGAKVPFLDIEAVADVICEYGAGTRSRPTEADVHAVERQFSFAHYADFVWNEGLTAVAQQAAIDDESTALMRSGTLNKAFFQAAGFETLQNLPAEFEYSAAWARGIRPAKSMIGFNDRVAAAKLSEASDAAPTALGNVIRLSSAPISHTTTFVEQMDYREPAGNAGRIALHLFAPSAEGLNEFLQNLGPSGRWMSLFVTTNTEDEAKEISALLTSRSRCRESSITVMPSGISPMGTFVDCYARNHSKFDLIGHFYLKNPRKCLLTTNKVDHQFLYEMLLGRSGESAACAMAAFETDTRLGLIFQEDPQLTDWNHNLEPASKLASELGVNTPLPAELESPIGGMFWARTAAIAALQNRKWKLSDFHLASETQQGAPAALIERLLPTLCEDSGHTWATLYNPTATRFSAD